MGREECRRRRKQVRCLSQYPSTLRAYFRTLNGDTDINISKPFFLWGSEFFSNGRSSLNRRLHLKLFNSVQCAWWNEGKILSIVICTPFLTAFFFIVVLSYFFFPEYWIWSESYSGDQRPSRAFYQPVRYTLGADFYMFPKWFFLPDKSTQERT